MTGSRAPNDGGVPAVIAAVVLFVIAAFEPQSGEVLRLRL